jgi:hypothetical protein
MLPSITHQSILAGFFQVKSFIRPTAKKLGDSMIVHALLVGYEKVL